MQKGRIFQERPASRETFQERPAPRAAARLIGTTVIISPTEIVEPCYLSIPDNINLMPGQSETYAIEYRPGIPPARFFKMEYYLNEEDAIARSDNTNLELFLNNVLSGSVNSELDVIARINRIKAYHDHILSQVNTDFSDPRAELKRLTTLFANIVNMVRFSPTAPNQRQPDADWTHEAFLIIDTPIFTRQITLWGNCLMFQ